MFKFLPPLISLLLAAGCSTASHSSAGNPSNADGVRIIRRADHLQVEIDGQLFTEYWFKDVPRPYYYPLMGPGEVPLTRNFPMRDAPHEQHDHPHHRSLWYAHGSVNRHDFWSEQRGFGKIVHTGFTRIESGRNQGLIRSRDNWVAPDGTVVCTDERTFRVYHPTAASERIFDFEITLHASHGDLVLGDTKEGSMAMRLAPTLRLKGEVGQGHILNSAGVRDDATWGKRADWCDYYGPVEGQTVGVAIFDNPQNPRHPTWWHVRDYGLFAANPFGEHDFEKLRNKSAGNLTVPSGKSITFRYRFYLHRGDTEQARVGQRYQAYVSGGL